MTSKQQMKSVISNVFAKVVKILFWLIGELFSLPRKIFERVKKILLALKQLWISLGAPWFRRTVLAIVLLVAGYTWLANLLKPNLTEENIYQVQYLNGGWDESDREAYYYTPQGTELLGMEYSWLKNIELPLSHDLLASEQNMRGWGFIVDPGQQATHNNPGNLPVGFSRHVDPTSKRERLDLGCAMCHTGELHYNGVALRIDGGQAIQSVSTVKQGEFIVTLGVAVIETYINPYKWDRFATRVVGSDEEKRKELRESFKGFIGKLKDFGFGPGATKYYPVEEGRGRTDAVGRIANVVFGYDLDVPENYKVADAPASYPFIWDMWRFDWVQYTGFTNQAMARNVGESLGVLAPIKLVDEKGNLLPSDEFGETVVDIEGMHCVETLLRDLEPPKWPEEVLGEIDIPRATRGKELFADQCAACHGPHESKPYQWPVASGPGQNPAKQVDVNWEWDMAGDTVEREGQYYRDDWRETIWALPWIETSVIGTDSKLADNYMDNKYDGSKIIPGSDPINAGDGLQILLNRLVPKLYDKWDVTGEAVPAYDGLNVPFRIINKRAYKARPLHGVWATAPFLHNGGVPTIYDLLSPQRERPQTFYVGNREYDPEKLGYITHKTAGSFLHDTSIAGNHNTGHLFTDENVPGRIGGLFTENQKLDLLEYIKVMGNPDFDERLGGDPQNWSQYSKAPADPTGIEACNKIHSRHGFTTAKTYGKGA